MSSYDAPKTEWKRTTFERKTREPFRVDPRLSVKFSRRNFMVDDRIHVALDFDLAVRVGEWLLKAPTEDKMIKALGHQLCNIAGEEEENNEEENW